MVKVEPIVGDTQAYRKLSGRLAMPESLDATEP